MNEMMTKTDKNQIKIVRAAAQDAAAICDVRDQAWLEAYPNAALGITVADIKLNAQGPNGEFVPRRIAYLKNQFAADDGSSIGMYVAKIDDKVVGYTDPRIDDRGRKRIGAMFVAPEAQGTGIGGKLLRQAISVLGRHEDIYLEVVAYNEKAIGFYKHFGFVKTDAVVPAEENLPSYIKSLPLTEMVLKAKQN